MALVVGTNSWATIIEADAYLDDKIDAEDWFTLVDTPENPGENSKSSFLVSAFRWIQSAPELEVPALSTSDNVKNAQIEAAYFLLGHALELNARTAAMFTGVSEFEYSKRREKLDINNLRIPDFIVGMISEYSLGNTTIDLAGEYDV